MAQFKQEQAERFIGLLTGDVSTVVTWQLFYDPKDGTKRPDLAAHFPASLAQAVPTIQRAENNLQGVYLCINETDGKGRFAANITKIRTLFADFDGQAEPNWPIPPHFITKRDDTHGHAYWLVDDVEVDEFMYLQYRIALAMNTDDQVIDPSRVARLPGSLHLKDPQNPAMYSLATDNNLQGRYTKQHILDGFTLTAEQLQKYTRWQDSRKSLGTGAGFDDDPIYINKVTQFLKKSADPAVEGNGTATLIRVISYAYDHGLTLETAQAIAWEHYNPRCIPPWSPAEQQHFDDVIERAYQYAKNEPGCRTAQAVFDIVPPPPPKPTVRDVVRNGDRLDTRGAAILSPQLTAKSSHYELAQSFDGNIYDGTKLIRCEKIFYEFNGRSWSIIADDVIKAKIQRFYSRFKPSDTLVRGVLNSLCDLVNVEHIENGIWLSDGKSAANVVCFRNGLVDLSNDNRIVIEHTPDFFCFNELEYDFTPGTTCPQWQRFLQEVFEEDLELIVQLQEWFGYCMTSDISMQKFASLIGKPRAGKGVIADILTKLVGKDNTAAPSLSKLTNDSSLYNMSTASVAFIPDAHSVHASKRDEVLSNFKSITGGDALDYHVIYKGTKTSVFKTRFVLSTNNMPEFVDASGALVARMLVFPFTKSFVGREDYGLKDRLHKEIAGVAQWALDGLKRLQRNGRFTEAQLGLTEKASIQHDMNPLSGFIDNVCVMSDRDMVLVDRLYESYLVFCKQHHISLPLSQNKLTRLIKASNMPIKHERVMLDNQRHYVFKGLSLCPFESINGEVI